MVDRETPFEFNFYLIKALKSGYLHVVQNSYIITKYTWEKDTPEFVDVGMIANEIVGDARKKYRLLFPYFGINGKSFSPQSPCFSKFLNGLKVDSLPEHFEAVATSTTLSELFPNVKTPPRLPWEITLLVEDIKSLQGSGIEPEDPSDIANYTLQTFRNYRRYIATRATSTVSAKFDNYVEIQGSRFPLLDGRFAATGPSTCAPPIELYHPVFANFRARCQDSTLIPSPEVLLGVAALFRELSRIHDRCGHRDAGCRQKLSDVLGIALDRVGNSDDYASLQETPLGISASPCFVSLKSELGSGGSDPSVQVVFSYERNVSEPEATDLLKTSTCPSFLISLAGPWIAILGAVFTTRVIAQRLAGYEWYGLSRANDDETIFAAAKQLYALRLCIADLREDYKKLSECIAEDGALHPRFFPYITSYVDLDGTAVQFTYIKPLAIDPSCVVFLAERADTNKDIVVKFTPRYCADAHKWMANAGYAPHLEACHPLGEGYGKLKIVVMEYVQGEAFHQLYGHEGPIPATVRETLDRARAHLRRGGFILPDFRRPNLMWIDGSDEHPLKIIDFDWAFTTKANAKEYDLITVQHEDMMYQNL
ncbi:hypothetical protein ONZ45_g11067 [Pleurotus djamor]|nr:hypothetical protein ONZ45_g11067 [Pleurotus djamor]